VNRLKFPLEEYNSHLGEYLRNNEKPEVSEFSFSAMILIALNRYCLQLIIYEICGIDFDFKQVYTYSFSEFEIESLAVKSPEQIIRHKSFIADYDFNLSTYSRSYKGQIKVDVTLSDNNTFESSFYTIEIEFVPESEMLILPYFLTDSGFKIHITEFMQKIWKPLWAKLENFNMQSGVICNNIEIDNLVTILHRGNLDIFKIPAEKRDFISDVFNIVYSICSTMSCCGENIELSADDIMSSRGLAKNINSKGVRGGYKNLERLKIHNALNGLNALDILNVRELSNFNYVIAIPPHIKSYAKFTFPKKLVEYNYKTQLWQRRLGFYLSGNKLSKIKVKELFEQVEELCGSFRPMQIRDKFESVMDELMTDGIIKDWRYEKIDEDALQGKNWLERWMKLYIIYRY